MTTSGLPHFDRLMRDLLGPAPARPRKCRHGSFYPEGRTPDDLELLRCSKCSAMFKYDGVRKVRV